MLQIILLRSSSIVFSKMVRQKITQTERSVRLLSPNRQVQVRVTLPCKFTTIIKTDNLRGRGKNDQTEKLAIRVNDIMITHDEYYNFYKIILKSEFPRACTGHVTRGK